MHSTALNRTELVGFINGSTRHKASDCFAATTQQCQEFNSL